MDGVNQGRLMGNDKPLNTQRHPTFAIHELRELGFADPVEVGRGGFGVVYRCTQPSLDRTVAVKILTVELDEENRARFFREQRAMGRLTGHPNIATVLQVGATDSGHPYIVMPYYQLDSLHTRIREHGPIPLDEALCLGVKLAGAVEAAHRRGILHRDVKPANILLTDYGEPVLADFGIARIAGGFETATSTVTGSPAYTAPEVLAGDPASAAADIYGLGAVMFSALTGHAAFERRSGEEVLAQFLRITEQPVPELSEHGIPDDVSATIARCMSRSAERRPTTAADLGEELRGIQSGHHFPVTDMALPAELGGEGKKQRRTDRSRPTVRPSLRAHDNLPLELNSFVDRRTELTDAVNRLAGCRLVTLTGTGGVGKTRLALRAAATVKRRFADGVWLVELSEQRNAWFLDDAVARVLGVQDHSARPLREVLVQHLTTRQLLLVLDNCEHMVDAVAELTETLLRVCPQLRILATSRERLALPGESVLHVPPLSLPDLTRSLSLRGLPRYDAMTLFAERGAAAVPGFAVGEDNMRTVADICHRLDGVPLALELAAARLRAMSPEQILERLADRYVILTHGTRGAPARQQTLRWSIDWTFELCSAREQVVWMRLSVFASSFELDAAEQVCGMDLASQDLLDTVSALVDKSILIREELGEIVRFRMLETLRDYGLEKLDHTHESVPLHRRHRDWYEGLALTAEAEWISPRQLDWIARLNREQSNIREALEFSIDDNPGAGLRAAGALHWFWSSQGLYNEAGRWFHRLLASDSGAATRERVKALHCASAVAGVLGDLQSGAALVKEGRALTSGSDDPMMRALIDYADGLLALYSGDPQHAHPLLDAARSEFSRHTVRTFEVAVLYSLGLAYELCGSTKQAVESHAGVLALTEPPGERIYRAGFLWALAISVWRQGDNDRAVHLLEQSLELARQVRMPRVVIYCLESLAWITCDRGNAHRAAVLMGSAEGLAISIGSAAVIHSDLLVYHHKCNQEAHRKLGDDAFSVAYQKGRHLDFDVAIAYSLHEQPARASASATDISTRLTKRERQIADQIAEGLTNRAIADKLVISIRTVQGHVDHILAKLGFTSRTQVAAWVARRTPEVT